MQNKKLTKKELKELEALIEKDVKKDGKDKSYQRYCTLARSGALRKKK